MNYNANDLEANVAASESLLITDQRQAYNKVLDMISNVNSGICFLDAGVR